MFATWTSSSLSRSLASADPDLSGSSAKNAGADSSRAYDPARLTKLEDTLKRYEDHFNRHLRILMDRYVMCFAGYFPTLKRGHPLTWVYYSLNYFAATESVVLLRLAHVLSMVSKDET